MTDKIITSADITHPVHWLALGFGSGLARKAPGTWGSVVGLLIFLPLLALPQAWYALSVLIASLAGVWICGKAARDWGVHDHGAIVWDEVAGMGVALFALPFGWQSGVLAFVLFRLFDIWKPWPISVLDQKVPGGAGIMIDDLAAGVLACVAGHLLAGSVLTGWWS